MQITRQQMLSGAARYIRGEVIPHIPDRGVKVVLDAFAGMVEMAPQAVSKYLDMPIVAAMLHEQDGFYDLDMVEAALTKAMETHGGLELTVPAIPLISPQPKSMTFTANDIRAMKRYMEGV
jgi:hypothetical protein